LGTGIWIGVQHLGYPEFGEIRRLAQRTIEQRHILVNNLAIRRATEELKVAESFSDITRILTAAFDSNDFDAFALRTGPDSPYGIHVVGESQAPQFLWTKSEYPGLAESGHAWSLKLNLVTAAHQPCGELAIFRRYASRDLQLDINLLTSGFAAALAHAIERTTHPDAEFVPSDESASVIAAQVV
jgi:hypothetical protein